MLTKERSATLTGTKVGQIIDRTGVTAVTKVLVFAAALGYLFDAFDNTMVGWIRRQQSKAILARR